MPDVDAVFVATPTRSISPTSPRLYVPETRALRKAYGHECRGSGTDDRGRPGCGLPLGVAHVFRFEDSTCRLRDRILHGNIGRPVLARAEFCYPALESARTWITDATLATGGPIADVGVHCIDALRFILNDEVVSVNCSAVQDERSGEVDCGGTLTLLNSLARQLPPSASRPARNIAPCSSSPGSMESSPPSMASTSSALSPWSSGPRQIRAMWREKKSRIISPTRASSTPSPSPSAATLLFPSQLVEGLRNQQVLDAAYRSWRTGTRQALIF